MRRALSLPLVALLTFLHVTASEDPLCENHCSGFLSRSKERDSLWRTNEACKVGCRFQKLDSFHLLEDNLPCFNSCMEAFSSDPSKTACLAGCAVPINHTSITEREPMSTSTDLDWLLQWFLTPFLTPRLILSKDWDPHMIHVVDITIVTMDDPNNPGRTVQKIMVLDGSIPLGSEGSYFSLSGVSLTDIATSPTSSSGGYLDTTVLTHCSIVILLLIITAIVLATILLCCFFFRHQLKDSKEVTEALRIAEGMRRYYRLPDGVSKDQLAIAEELYKPPLPPSYKQALEESQLIVRVAVSKEPRIIEGIITVVPNKQQS